MTMTELDRDAPSSAAPAKPGAAAPAAPQDAPAGHQDGSGNGPRNGPGNGPGDGTDTAFAPLSRRKILIVFSGLMLTVLLAALDQTIVATALPTIVGDLNGLDQISWVVTAYLLASTIVLPIYGKLGDLFGRKGIFQIAIVIFLVGSALAGWSQNMEELVAFRALQGVGAGGLMIGAQAIIADVVPARERGRYMGLIGGVFGLSSVVGPLLGGVFTEHASWRWCFYVNIPLGILALFVTAAVLKLPKHDVRPRLDYLGTLVLAGGSTCLVLLGNWGGTRYAWDSQVILGLAAGTVACLALFVLVEHRATEPIIPLRLFREPIFTVAALIGLVVGMAMFGAIAYLPVFLQMVDGASPTESGLLMLPMVAGIFVGSVLAGRLMSSTGRYKIFPILGTLIAGAGMLLLSRMDAESSRISNGGSMAVLGFGIGLVMPVLVLAVQNAVRQRDLGVATSASNYFRQIGACLGTAIFGSLFTHRLAEHLAGELPPGTPAPDVSSLTPDALNGLPDAVRHTFVQAFAETLPPIFAYAVPALAVGFLLAFVLKEKRLETGASPTTGSGAPAPNPLGSFEENDDTSGETAMPIRNARKGPATSTAAVPAQQAYEPEDRAPDRAEEAAPYRLHVTARRTDGEPVPGAVLTLLDVAGQQAARSIAAGDGRYTLEPGARGHYVLVATVPGYRPRATTLEVGDTGSATLELTLAGESGLFGRVRRVGGGCVAGATVTLTDRDGAVVATTTSSGEGDYAVKELVPGTYTMTASAPAYRPAAAVVEVTDAGELRQDIELIGGARVTGRIRAREAGRPLPGARVSLVDPDGTLVGVTITGRDGGYSFADVAEGHYTIVATSYPPAASSLRVSAGLDAEHDLDLGFD